MSWQCNTLLLSTATQLFSVAQMSEEVKNSRQGDNAKPEAEKKDVVAGGGSAGSVQEPTKTQLLSVAEMSEEDDVKPEAEMKEVGAGRGSAGSVQEPTEITNSSTANEGGKPVEDSTASRTQEEPPKPGVADGSNEELSNKKDQVEKVSSTYFLFLLFFYY